MFQPGGDKQEEQAQMGPPMRTPSKLETAKRAKELREMVKKERPVPMQHTLDKMPEEAHRKGFYFYADDGGFQATHEDDRVGEEIYYLGIIDCLTRVSSSARVGLLCIWLTGRSTTWSKRLSTSGKGSEVTSRRSRPYRQTGTVIGLSSS